jgi:DNA polymerase
MMTNNKKQNLIKYFQTLKSFGYSYNDDVNFHISNNDDNQNLILPTNIKELETIVHNCNLCELSKNNKNRFFSVGHIYSKVMIIGDYPIVDLFNPYSGQAGKMLSNMCTNVLKLDINSIYYTTILKCTVSINNTIDEEYIEQCKDYLLKQIEIVKPLIILVYDTKAYEYLKQKANLKTKYIILTKSPTYLLRNPSYKKEAMHDLVKVRAILDKQGNS